MSFESFRAHCATLPGATMDVKWGADEVYSVGGRMFAAFRIDDGAARSVSFKCDPARFLELTDIPGVVPAPYLARAHWVQVQRADAIGRLQMRALLDDSHARVLARLPRRTQMAIAGGPAPVPKLPITTTKRRPRASAREAKER
jgi:predicted DNA-binding protein (MmcQ/YjbR family)